MQRMDVISALKYLYRLVKVAHHTKQVLHTIYK